MEQLCFSKRETPPAEKPEVKPAAETKPVEKVAEKPKVSTAKTSNNTSSSVKSPE